MNLHTRIPPVLVALICGLLMGFIDGFEVDALSVWRLLLALAIALLGGAICLAAVLSFQRAHTTVNPLLPQAATTLIGSGIYRYSRNPMYLGFAMVLLGWAIGLGSLLALLGVAGFVLYIQYFQIAAEEQALQQRFGASFSRYRLRVRRWL